MWDYDITYYVAQDDYVGIFEVRSCSVKHAYEDAKYILDEVFLEKDYEIIGIKKKVSLYD